MKETYSNQVQLLVRLLAYVQKETSLALKGGTAINLFLRDMPRLIDILAGKLCAALDCQHPRDIFDVDYILEAKVMDDRLRTAFLVYLISHNRPISELLAPNEKELDRAFVEEFDGMTQEPITVEQLNEIRTRFFSMILPWLTEKDREFLIGFKKGEPDWEYLGIDHVRDLPSVRWKQYNLERITPQARRASIRRLEQVLKRS